jgi:glucose-6-phosphate isomerase
MTEQFVIESMVCFVGVAITQENSLLDNTARIEGWLARFPMFDWVGGRTSEMSAVGLLLATLQASAFPFFMYVDFIHTLSN